MAQAQGSNAQLIFGEEITYKSTPVLSLHDCEAAWDESTDPDATVTADSAVKKCGTNSMKSVIAVGMTAGDIVATDNFAAKNLSNYTHVGFWYRSSVVLAAGDLQLLLDDTALCASPLETLNIPAVAAGEVDTWKFAKVALATPASDTAIISIGLKYTVDKGAMTFYLDGIVALKEGRIFAFNSEGLGMSRNLITSKAIRTSRQPQMPSLGKKEVAGNIVMELHPAMIMLFKHLLGTYSVAGGAAPYTHTFKIGSSLPVGLTIDKVFDDISQVIRENGCKINSMGFSSPDEGPIPVTFDLMGAKESADADGLPFDSDPVDKGFSPFDAFQASIKQGGSSLGTVTAFDIKIENNLDGSVYVFDGTGERHSMPAGKVKVSGSLEVLFEDLTLYNLALNNTETSLEIIFTKGDGLGGSAGNEKLTISFDEIKFGAESPKVAGDAGVKLSLPFEAYYDNDADASAVVMTLLSPLATY